MLRDQVNWRFGPLVTENGVLFRLWAPLARKAALILPGRGRVLDMTSGEGGWFTLKVGKAGPGTLYAFSLDEGSPIPDPASPFQPASVEGPGMVVDHGRFGWQATGWEGRPWPEAVIYELHVGTFTPEGTYRAAIDKLDLLVELGITAIQLMPLHAFPGRWGWSYDGVGLFAPAACYGRPEDLVALVDAAHLRGLMVLLDVVYNHFGPQGNHMTKAMPLLSQSHEAEFGTPPNLDGEMASEVRRFLIENALHWLVRYRFDGLRFDASHEFHDESRPHFLKELADAVKRHISGRKVHLILENSRNQASWLARDAMGRPQAYTAQWSDNIHHALHVAMTGENEGFYTAFNDPVPQLARALAEGFSFQGEVPPDADTPLGEPSAHLPPTAFIAYVQNHDQVGNRPGGRRIGQEIDADRLKVMATVVMLSPSIPLIFMGEEWNAATPFFYFADLEPSLRKTVRRARRDMLARWGRDEPTLDPFDPAAFETSRLDWSERERPGHLAFLTFYRSLIEMRRKHLVPRLAGIGGHAGRVAQLGPRSLRVDWRLADGAIWRLELHLDGLAPTLPLESGTDLLWATGEPGGPAARVWLVSPRSRPALPR